MLTNWVWQIQISNRMSTSFLRWSWNITKDDCPDCICMLTSKVFNKWTKGSMERLKLRNTIGDCQVKQSPYVWFFEFYTCLYGVVLIQWSWTKSVLIVNLSSNFSLYPFLASASIWLWYWEKFPCQNFTKKETLSLIVDTHQHALSMQFTKTGCSLY